jgi:hypothetical protein
MCSTCSNTHRAMPRSDVYGAHVRCVCMCVSPVFPLSASRVAGDRAAAVPGVGGPRPARLHVHQQVGRQVHTPHTHVHAHTHACTHSHISRHTFTHTTPPFPLPFLIVQPRRPGDGGACHLRHHAVHPPARTDHLHGPGARVVVDICVYTPPVWVGGSVCVWM